MDQQPRIMKSFINLVDRVAAKSKAIDSQLEKPVRKLLPGPACCQALDLELLRSNKDAKILKTRAHGLPSLGDLLAEFAPSSSTTPMSKIQEAALKGHELCVATKFVGECYLLDLVRTYYSIFDQMYFFGTITKRVPLKFKNLKERKDGFTTRGRTTYKSTFGHKTYITLDCKEHTTQRDIGDDETKIFLSLLGTLLHEMIHAFFFLHSCYCSPECMDDSDECEGSSGHGPPWHIAALAIEKSANNRLGLKTNLGRASTLELEIFDSGSRGWHYWPLPEEFEKLEIDPVTFGSKWEGSWVWDATGLRLKRLPYETSLNTVEIENARLDMKFDADAPTANGIETAMGNAPPDQNIWQESQNGLDDPEGSEFPWKFDQSIEYGTQ